MKSHVQALRSVLPAVAATFVLTVPVLADDWPQWRGPQRDGVWRETGIVDRFAAPEIPIKWRQPIGPGYSGPTVAAGRVYLTDRQTNPKQLERVHCFDAATGKPIWRHDYDCVYKGIGYEAGPRASVIVNAGRAYSLGAMGHLFCFDAASGEVLWQKDLNTLYNIQMPNWGIAAAPLIDGESLFLQIGGAGACVVALDKNTGAELWKALDDPAQYSAPIMIQQAGKRVLVVWTGAGVVGLNPTNGSVYWREAMKPTRMPIGIVTPITDGQRLFVSSFYDGALMLRLKADEPAVERIWRQVGRDERNTLALHSVMSSPILDGDYLYGVDSYGELRGLNADTGERLWIDLTAVPKDRWANIHMVPNGDRVFMFNERGELLIGRLSPQGFTEVSRAKLIDPTPEQLDRKGGVCWSHPAYAGGHVFARNDRELLSADLRAEAKP